MATQHTGPGSSWPTSTDLIVVGAGVTGATVAREAARRGLGVVVLEAAPDIGGGCSYANAALIAPEHVAPLATPAALRDAARQLVRRPAAVRIHPDPGLVAWLSRLAAASVSERSRQGATLLRELAAHSAALHEGYAAAGLAPTYRRSGSVDVYLRPPGRKAGPALSAAALRRLEPALGLIHGGDHHPDEAILESRSYIHHMLADAEQAGARVLFGHGATGLETDRGRVSAVRTAGGRVRADHVVIASGLGTARLAAGLGVDLPLRGGRGYIVDLERSERTPQMAVRFKEHRVVVTPLPDRVRVAGYMEFGAEGTPLDSRRSRQLLDVALGGLPPLMGQRILDVWAGERPCTSDGLPAIGSTQAAAGLSFAVGHGMWGLVLAPVTAHLVLVDLLDGAGAVPSLLSPDRFTRRLGPAA